MKKKTKIIIVSILILVVFLLSIILLSNKKYEVKFNSDTINTQIVKKGNKIIKPQDPIKEGYDFGGWEVDGKIFDFNTEITKDITLNPIWTKKESLKYNVTFNSNGGSSIPSQNTNKINTDNIIPNKEGYKFLGWFYNDELFDLNSKIIKNINLVAKWEKIEKTPIVEKPESKPIEKPVFKPATPIINVIEPNNLNGDLSFKIKINNINKNHTYELYEKLNNDYKYLNDIENDSTIKIKLGNKKEYAIKAYFKNNQNQKVYSDYSNIIKIDNSKIATPILSLINNNIENSNINIKLSIFKDGEYSRPYQINGYELYEVIEEGYRVVTDTDKEYNTVVKLGNKKEYVARAYVINDLEEKVYSDYSNVIKIDNSTVETPKISINSQKVDTNFNITANINLNYLNKETNKDEIYKNIHNGFEVYEKLNGNYILLEDIKESKTNYNLVIPNGLEKIIKLRTYVINDLEEKVYSDYSNELYINNKLETPKIMSIGANHTDKHIQEEGITIIHSQENGNNRVDGFELYQIVNNDYILLKDLKRNKDNYTGFDMCSVNVETGKKITISARTYVIINNEKVYSDYSKNYTIENPSLETPNLNIKRRKVDKENRIISFTIDSNELWRLDGYEIYEKMDNKVSLVNSGKINKINDIFIADTIDVISKLNTKKSYLARTYLITKNNEKIYSNYSDIINIEGETIETPLISKISNNLNDNLEMECKFKIDNLNLNKYKYEVYSSLFNANYKIENINDLNNIIYVLPVHQSIDFNVKSYIINKDGKKNYSEFSNTINFNNIYMPKPILKEKEIISNTDNSKTYIYEITNINEYKNVNLTNYKIYEHQKNGIGLIENGQLNDNYIKITVSKNSQKNISIVLYKINNGTVISTNDSDVIKINN